MRAVRYFSIGKVMLLLVCATMLGACSSGKPAKYRKKRGCDCPRWNHAPGPVHDGTRAMSSPFTTPGRG